MIYNPKKGWTEVVEPVVLKESFEEEMFKAEKNVEEITNHLKNIENYANYVIQEFRKNPNNMTNHQKLENLTLYLRKNIGPGMIGNWS
jgi:hypothetical protein